MTDPNETHVERFDRCFRCDYDLRGITDDQPCPECGLLAAKSRQAADELRHAHPSWLSAISRGVLLIFASIPFIIIGPILARLIEMWVGVSSSLIATTIPPAVLDVVEVALASLGPMLLVSGVFLVTRQDVRQAAEGSDRFLRNSMRLLVFAPLIVTTLAYADAFVFAGLYRWMAYRQISRGLTIAFVALAVSSVLPLLIFVHLRNLLRRADSSYLAGRCLECGLGSAIVIVVALFAVLIEMHPERFGLSENWGQRGLTPLIIELLVPSGPIAFGIWSATLLLRFAIRFHTIAKRRAFEWRLNDMLLQNSGSLKNAEVA